VFILLHLFAPLAQPVDLNTAALLSALALACVTVAVIACVVAANVPRAWLLPGFVGGLLLEVGGSQLGLVPALEAAVMGLSLLSWVTCAGVLAALGLRQRGYLVMAALVIAIADIYNVFFGPAAAIAAGEATGWIRAWGKISLLAGPLLGSNDTVPLIGAGDFLFPALFLEAARKFELGLSRTYWAVIGAFLVGLITLHLTDRAIPALVFIGPAFLLVNWRQIKPAPTELRKILTFCGSMILLFTVLAVLKKIQGR
jgi:hypothetical protein